MIRAFAIFFLSLSTILVFSQEPTVKKNPLENFYFAPSIGVEVMNIKNYTAETNGFTVVYKGVPSIRTGLDVEYRPSKKLAVSTGLFFSAKNYNRVEKNTEGNAQYFYDQKFKNRYIETLIGAAYNFVNTRFDVSAYTNFNFACLLNTTETRLTETGNKFINNNKPSFNKILTVLEPGLSFNYNINYRLSFGLKTGYRLYLNSISIEKKFSHNGALIQSGLYYKF